MNTALLVMDDPGAEYHRDGGPLDAAMEEVFWHREAHRLTTVVTSNKTLSELHECLPGRIVERLQGPWGRRHAVAGPTFPPAPVLPDDSMRQHSSKEIEDAQRWLEHAGIDVPRDAPPHRIIAASEGLRTWTGRQTSVAAQMPTFDMLQARVRWRVEANRRMLRPRAPRS